MKKRIITILAALFITSMVSAASLKDGVCIVRSNMSSETKELLSKYRDTMKSEGYSKYSEGINKYLEGSFGSGFIYQASNGKKFVVTNRHVVESADTVTIQFEKEDGTFAEYKELKILAVDIDLDVAVIELPAEVKTAAVPVKVNSVNDGDDVWTAGFPGLAGKPAWQFGKGAVTNSSARLEKLVAPEITTLIQHSAQIDAGNSGGPLLVKDASSAYGYSVVGINTWKAFNRENTNFSIPAKAVKTFVENVISNNNSGSKIENCISKFEKSIANNEETFGRMGNFISDKMISSLDSDTFVKIYEDSSSETREVIMANFVADPIEGIRYALAAYIWNAFRKGHKPEDFLTAAPEAADNTYNVSFQVKEKVVYTSSWIMDQGIWRLADFDGLIGNAEKRSAFSFGNPYVLDVFGGLVTSPETGFNLGFDMRWFKVMEYGFQLSHDKIDDVTLNIFDVRLKLILPFVIKNIYVAPYGLAGFGTFINSDDSFDFSFGYEVGAGLEAGYDLGKILPFVAFEYAKKQYTEAFNDTKHSKSGISINAGIKIGKTSGFKFW